MDVKKYLASLSSLTEEGVAIKEEQLYWQGQTPSAHIEEEPRVSVKKLFIGSGEDVCLN